MMRTRQAYTFEALKFQFIDENSCMIDIEYLNEYLSNYLENVSNFYHTLCDNRRSPVKSVVWHTLMEVANEHLKQYGYDDYYASSNQLKTWLKKYGNDYDTLADTIQYATSIREEALAEKAAEKKTKI